MSNTARREEIDSISRSLSERLARVCSHMSEPDFAFMVNKMAELQWRSEHRSADAFAASLLSDVRSYGAR